MNNYIKNPARILKLTFMNFIKLEQNLDVTDTISPSSPYHKALEMMEYAENTSRLISDVLR